MAKSKALKLLGLVVLAVVCTWLTYSLVYTTYKAAMKIYQSYKLDTVTIDAYYAFWGMIPLVIYDALAISSTFDIYRAVVRRATRLVPKEGCGYKGLLGKTIKEGLLWGLSSAFILGLFYNLYALLIKNINPMHPYYPYYISTNIAFVVIPVIAELTNNYKFGTESEYIEFVLTCIQTCIQIRYIMRQTGQSQVKRTGRSWDGRIDYHT